MNQECESKAIDRDQSLWWMMFARFIGLDVHKEYVTAVGIDLAEKVVLRVRRIALADFGDWVIENLTSEDAVILESTTNAWLVNDLVEPFVGRCVVMHPDRKKKVKTDIADATELAKRLMRNDVKEVWVPPVHVQELRELMSYRQRKVKSRVMVINRLKSVLHRLGFKQPVEKVLGQKYRKWWTELDLSTVQRFKTDLELDAYDLFTQQIKEVDQEIARLSATPEWDENLVYLMQLPGIGLIHGMTILSAIGDIARFDSPKKLIGYAGLGAKVEQSGQKEKRGGITKSGRRDLRTAVIEAAHVAVRQKGRWQKCYERLAPRIGHNKALVAVARKMLVVSWHLLTKRVVDSHAHPEKLAAKFMKWAWQVGAEARRGMKTPEFIRYYLTLLGFGDWERQLVRGGQVRPIATLTELLESFPNFATDPRFQDALADP